MWSDAARASSMQSRGGSLGGNAPATGGTSSIGPAGNISGGSQGIQSRLAQAGASSRGQWGKSGKNPTQRVVINGVAAHQIGVHEIVRSMDAASAPVYRPNSYYSNVAY